MTQYGRTLIDMQRKTLVIDLSIIGTQMFIWPLMLLIEFGFE